MGNNSWFDGSLDYKWDFKNRLVEVKQKTTPFTRVAFHQYDADNRRVSWSQTDILGVGTKINFVLDGRHEVEDRDQFGQIMRQYVYGPTVDELIEFDDNGLYQVVLAGIIPSSVMGLVPMTKTMM